MPEMVPSQRPSPQASQGEGLHLQQQEHHQSSQGEDQGSLIQHHRGSSQGHDQGLHLQHLAHRRSSQGHGTSSQNWEGEVKNAENAEHPVDLQKTKEIKEEINVKVLNKKFMKWPPKHRQYSSTCLTFCRWRNRRKTRRWWAWCLPPHSISPRPSRWKVDRLEWCLRWIAPV